MKLLLDTHIFLWYISGDHHLPKDVKDIIQDPMNDVSLSVVSLWESIVKYRLGKLLLPLSPEKYLPLQRERHNILSLSLEEAEIIHLSDLPPFHRDPFDRMLICQAIEHNMTIVSMDSAIAQYPTTGLNFKAWFGRNIRSKLRSIIPSALRDCSTNQFRCAALS